MLDPMTAPLAAKAVVAELERHGREDRVMAWAYSLIREGVSVVASTGGVRKRSGAPVTASTTFCIGSITKLLLSVACQRFVERGLLDMGAPVSTFAPDARFDDPRAERITVAHLLSHTSGLPAAGRDWGPHDDQALDRFVREDLATHRMRTEPGELAVYSSSAISLVGWLLERLDGASFPSILRREVLEPAGMHRAVWPADIDDDACWPIEIDGPAVRLADNAAGYPSGFLFASLDDMTSLATTLPDGHLMSVDSMRRIGTERSSRHVAHAPFPTVQATTGYGLGCFTGTWSGRRLIRHGGVQQSFNCSIDFVPETGAASILLTNGMADADFSRVFRLCLEALAGPTRSAEAAVRRVSKAVEPAVGTFVDDDSGRIVELELQDGATFLREGSDVEPLIDVGAGASLTAEGSPVWWPDGGDAAPFITIWGTPFFRTTIAPWDGGPSPDACTGTYADSFYRDATTDLTISHAGATWTVTGDGYASDARVVGPGKLASDHGLIEFLDDGARLRLGGATLFDRV
jgi:CubicO group peptidase (beta-lactamase class C family)